MKQTRCLNCGRNGKYLNGMCNFCNEMTAPNRVALIGHYYSDWLEAKKAQGKKEIISLGKGFLVVSKEQLLQLSTYLLNKTE